MSRKSEQGITGACTFQQRGEGRRGEEGRGRQRQRVRVRSLRLRRAFSLVEILTAAVLLSFLIIPVVNLVLSSSTHIRRGAISTQALLLAQAHMEFLLTKPFDQLEAQAQKKIEGGRFRRRVEVDHFQGNENLKQIDVWIRWTDGASGKERARVLRTLRCRREGE